MDDVNYSCRHSRAGGNPKALRYFFALRFPVKLGMTTVHVEAYKTACCINTSMVGTKNLQATEHRTPKTYCQKEVAE